MKFLVALLLAVVCWPSTLLAESPTPDQIELLKRLEADLGMRHEDAQSLADLGVFHDAIEGLLMDHAGRFQETPERLEPLLEFMTSRRIILAKGEMAAVAYHTAIGAFDNGDLGLNAGLYAKWEQDYPESPLPVVLSAAKKLTSVAEAWRVAISLPNDKQDFTADMRSLESIRKYLISKKAIGSRSPYWYSLMVEVSVFLERDAAEIRDLVREGLDAYPENVQLAVLGSSAYLSKWGGDASGLAEYAKWATDLASLKSRPDIYPRIYFHAMWTQYKITLFKVVDTDWTLMRPGLVHMIKSHQTNSTSNMAAALSCLGGDRMLTVAVMHMLPFGPNPYLWPDWDAPGICSNWAAAY